MTVISNTKETLPIHTVIYLMYVMIIWANDFFNLICFALRSAQNSWVTQFAVLCFISLILLYIRNAIQIKIRKFSKIEFGICLFILIYAIIRGIIPDLSYDTSLAHFSNLFPEFLDINGENAFLSEMATYGLPLNDRMFYPTYALLGYRMGNIMIAIAVIVTYLTVVDILYLIKNNCASYVKNLKSLIAPELFGFLVVFTFYISANIALYMVDALALPLLVEMLRLFLLSSNKLQNDKNKIVHIYFAILVGFSFSMKLTNVIYVLVLLIGYLILNRTKITLKIFVLGIILAIIPIGVYCTYSYCMTGNPTYPFYNEIFKSPFYLEGNFKDTRWGPQGLLEIILWPIYTFFRPMYKMSELSPALQCSVCLGFISSMVLLIKNGKKITDWYLFPFLIGFIFTIYMWTITTGYARYIMFGEIWGGLIVWILILELQAIKEGFFIKRFMPILFIFFLFVQMVYGQFLINYKGIEWAWRPPIAKLDNFENYVENVKYILKDKGAIGKEETRDKIDLIVQTGIYNNLVKLIYEGKPTVNMQAISERSGIVKENKAYAQRMNGKIMKYQKADKGVYTIDLNTEFENTITNQNLYGFKIKNAEIVESYFEPNKYAVLYEVGKMENAKNKIFWIGKEENKYNVNRKNGEVINFSGIVAIVPYATWDLPTMVVQIHAKDEFGNEKLAYSQDVKKLEFYDVNVDLNLEGLYGDIDLEFRCTAKEGGTTIDSQFITVINLNLSK